MRALLVASVVLSILVAGDAQAALGLRRPDPAQMLPLDQIAPQHRASVAEVIRDHTFHRLGKADRFPSDPRLYLGLLGEPALTLALWQDIVPSPARLTPTAPGRYEGVDGAGATAIWEFVLRSDRLNVLLCTLEYATPRGNARFNGRLVMIVRTSYGREADGVSWVQHHLECFVKVDSRGWKAVAATFRPLVEKVLEDQIQEAGWFVSLMARLVETYPDWAVQIADRQTQISPQTRQAFRAVVTETRRGDASTGRPVLASRRDEQSPTRVR